MTTSDKKDKGARFTLVNVPDPEQGVSRDQYEAVCRAPGIEPKPPKKTEAVISKD